MPDPDKVKDVSPEAEVGEHNLKDDAAARLEAEATKSLDSESKKLDFRQKQINVGGTDFYAQAVFYTTVLWLAFIAVTVLLQGFLGSSGFSYNWIFGSVHLQGSIHFHLSDGIILALIGGSTITGTGLFVIVLNHFFKGK
jgi:hypothetical protein